MLYTLKWNPLITAVIIIIVAFISAMPTAAQQRVYPQQPNLVEPANGATIPFPGTSNPVTFRWSSVIGATRYEVNVRVGNIPRPPVETTATSAAINLNLPLSNQNTLVFWSVRAGDDSGYSTQQVQTSSFVVASSGGVTPTVPPTPIATPTPAVIPLTKPRLLTPADGEKITINAAVAGINFDWSDVQGADKYILRIYKDNEIERQIDAGVSQAQRIRVETVIEDTFQWDVEAVQNRSGKTLYSKRFSFAVGSGVLPSPTPIPQSADLNKDAKLDAQDVILFASLFLTNAPVGDFNNTGIQDRMDVLKFLEMFASAQ